jgi:hypothetical protein
MEYSNLILIGVAEQWKVYKLFKDAADKPHYFTQSSSVTCSSEYLLFVLVAF